MPDIFFCPRTWQRIFANTGIGNRSCTISANAKSSTGCACTCLTSTRMASAIRKSLRNSDQEEGDPPLPLAFVQLLLSGGPRLRLHSFFCCPRLPWLSVGCFFLIKADQRRWHGLSVPCLRFPGR